MTNIERLLKEREILTKVIDKVKNTEIFTYVELKVLFFLSVSLLSLGYFFGNYAFDTSIFLGILVYAGFVSGLFMGVAFISAFWSDNSKIIKDKVTFYSNSLTSEEFLLFKNMFPEIAFDLESVEKEASKRLKTINEKLLEEETVKDFHTYLLNDQKAMSVYLPLFKSCLKKFNEKHNWQENEVVKVNQELESAGLPPFFVENKELKLTIEES